MSDLPHGFYWATKVSNNVRTIVEVTRYGVATMAYLDEVDRSEFKDYVPVPTEAEVEELRDAVEGNELPPRKSAFRG
jgi:hypothetical protein